MYLEAGQLRDVLRILDFWAPGVLAYAFGSRVHGQRLKPTSDLDICLKGEGPLPSKMLREVRNAFDVSDLPMRVDVVDWFDLGADFQKTIASDLMLLSTNVTTAGLP